MLLFVFCMSRTVTAVIHYMQCSKYRLGSSSRCREHPARSLHPMRHLPQVRYIGVSNETSYGVSEFAHAAKTAGLPKIQTIQNVYHLLQRGSFETDLAETCRCVLYSSLFLSCTRALMSC